MHSNNSLAPGRFRFNFRYVIFKLILVNDGWGISQETALRLMPLDLTDDKSTLVQVMAWYRQATSHYLSQCWPRSMSPNGVTRRQWVNSVVVKLEKVAPRFQVFTPINICLHSHVYRVYHILFWYRLIWPISFKGTPLIQGQSWANAREETLQNMVE